MRGDDEVGSLGDFRCRHKFRIGLHGNRDPGVAGGGREPVFAIRNDNPDDVDTASAQHFQCRHAKMAGTDEGDPHGGFSVTVRFVVPSITRSVASQSANSQPLSSV